MTAQELKKLSGKLFALGIAAFLLFGYMNCTSPASFEDSGVAASSGSALSFSYSPNPLYIGTTATMVTTGGTAPYTYSLYYGVGSVNGNFYSSTTEGYATIMVTDAAGLVQYSTIYTYTNSGSGSYSGTIPTLAANVVYRFVAPSRHLFSLNSAEGAYVGMALEGAVFKTLTNQDTNSIPLYRCYIPSMNSHFVTTSAVCNGFTAESIYGYIYTYQAANTTPLYSFYNANYDYIVTTNYAEGVNAGMIYVGILGYVPF